MEEKIITINKEYTYVKNYKDNSKLREELNILTEKTYGFNFREWYEAGYLGEVE